MRRSVWPVIETEERSNPVQIEGYDLDRWKRCKLRVAGAMIPMPVGMRDQEWKLFAIFIRQQLQDRFRQWHYCRVGDGAGINQKSFIGPDEKIDKICFKVCAWTLAKDKRLGLISVHLQGRLRQRYTILGTDV